MFGITVSITIPAKVALVALKISTQQGRDGNTLSPLGGIVKACYSIIHVNNGPPDWRTKGCHKIWRTCCLLGTRPRELRNTGGDETERRPSARAEGRPGQSH